MDKVQNPCCIGLDTRISFVPSFIKQQAVDEHGNNFKAAAKAMLEFNKNIIDATYDLIPVYKIQFAFYEQYGEHGIRAIKKTVEHIKKKGKLVIIDVKRNDIGSTSKAYANAYLGKVELCDGSTTESYFDADAITINPYLGSDGILPFVEACKAHGKGIFVLVKTSNPSSSEFQNRVLAGSGTELYKEVARMVEEWGGKLIGRSRYSSVGMVVGATYPKEARECRKIAKNSIVLVPGYGAQGGKASDVVANFNKDGLGAIIHSARGIILAYKSERFKTSEDEFDQAARNAALAMINDVVNALKQEGLCRW